MRGGKLGKEDDRERARREREEWERLEWEKVEKERAERRKIERERAERETRERIERERIERERAERERVERERMESERKEKERVERQREMEERERVERVRTAREREERIMLEQMEEERAERQRERDRQSESLGPRPSPLGEDSPPVGKAHSFGLHKVPSWPQQAEEEGKIEIAPRRVGSGRVLSEAHVREREAGRGAAVEEARMLMEKMRMEERQQQQQQGWSRERRQPVESGPRPYSGRGGVEKLNDWEESGRKREEGGWRAPGGVGRPSSALTLDSFLLPEGPRPVKGRGGGKKGMMANPGTTSNYQMDEKSDWNKKEWSRGKS